VNGHILVEMAAADEIPPAQTLKKAGEFEVYDQEGQKHKFSSLYAEKQTMVIFVRHFFCGNCMVPRLPQGTQS
jgi:hypothetical protein